MFEEHLNHPKGRGRAVDGGHVGVAGGAACGDMIRITLRVEGDRVVAAGYEASGCGAIVAAGSAVVTLAHGAHVFDAARISARAVSEELGGLSPGKFHAADLAADALHSGLGAATRAGAALDPDPDRTLVAMSGGVDSAVAALLVAREGREAVAVTLELWRDPDNDADSSCCSASAVRAARAVAHDLGLPHFTLDLRPEFRDGVVDPWLADHRAGLTPNPCIRCNGNVRLDAMLAFADSLGCADLATGHYARVTRDGLLRSGEDPAKDQSYMLAALDPRSVARMRFPLAELSKPQVRALAGEAGLAVASKKESQDLCFLAGTGRAAFLAKHGGIRERPGDIVDRSGRRIGRHRGAHEFTVGQRKGLGLAASHPLYVLETDAAANTVTVGAREDLRTDRVIVRDAVLHRDGAEVDAVKLRYRSTALRATVNAAPGRHDRLEVSLIEPADAGAPGQAAVLLSGDVIVGHGTIA